MLQNSRHPDPGFGRDGEGDPRPARGEALAGARALIVTEIAHDLHCPCTVRLNDPSRPAVRVCQLCRTSMWRDNAQRRPVTPDQRRRRRPVVIDDRPRAGHRRLELRRQGGTR